MRILVVQTAYLGDVVLILPLLRRLKGAFPAASISVLTTRTSSGALEGCRAVDRRLVLDKRWDRRGRDSHRALLRELMNERFDVAVAAHRSVRTGVIVRLSGARSRIGFAGAPGAWAYTDCVEWRADHHAVRRYLALAGPLGIDANGVDPRPRLELLRPSAMRARELLQRHGVRSDDRIVCLAPGSIWATKRWRPEGFARVADAARRRELVPVLLGSGDERELCERVASLARCAPVVLAGETSIPDLAALMARGSVAICNDSGAAHVAAAVGTPVVSVFGSTSPRLGYAPFGAEMQVVEHEALDCRPCGRHGAQACPLGHFRCMTEIRPERVVERMDRVLQAAATRTTAQRPIRPGRPARIRAGQPAAGVAPG